MGAPEFGYGWPAAGYVGAGGWLGAGKELGGGVFNEDSAAAAATAVLGS